MTQPAERDPPWRRARRHVALIGARGAGKSAVGRALAEALSLPFVDVDERVEAAAGCTIRQLFEQFGESQFRQREAVALRQALSGPPGVLATGGGAVLLDENRRALRERAVCLWLSAPADVLWRRVEADPAGAARRPDLTARGGPDEMREILRAREALYRAAADAEIRTDGRSLAEVVAESRAALDSWQPRSKPE